MVNTKLKQFRHRETSDAGTSHGGEGRIEKRRAKRKIPISFVCCYKNIIIFTAINRILSHYFALFVVDYVSPLAGRSPPPEFITWRAYDAPNVIKITSLNESIDTRYCLENTCSDSKRGNFTYYVPVSKYMPHIPLEVEFG